MMPGDMSHGGSQNRMPKTSLDVLSDVRVRGRAGLERFRTEKGVLTDSSIRYDAARS